MPTTNHAAVGWRRGSLQLHYHTYRSISKYTLFQQFTPLSFYMWNYTNVVYFLLVYELNQSFDLNIPTIMPTTKHMAHHTHQDTHNEVGNDMSLQSIGDDGGGVPWQSMKHE